MGARSLRKKRRTPSSEKVAGAAGGSDAGALRRRGLLVRHLGRWVGGILIGLGATTVAGYMSGLLQLLLPGPADAVCRYVEAPLLERVLDTAVPGILVVSFVGEGGQKAARDVESQVRSRTGLPVVRTCRALPLVAGPAASSESINLALDSARRLADRRGADVVVFGEMRGDETAELSVTNTAEFAVDQRVRIRTGSKASTGASVEEFIDDRLLYVVRDWASATSSYVADPRRDPEIAEREALRVAALAEHDPPHNWDSLDNERETLKAIALDATFGVAKWLERCRTATEAASIARPTVFEQLDGDAIITVLQVYAYCPSRSDWSGE